ncbi:MAG TPA: beta-galactosidase [Tepidisphaeraceae bacterium]|nr:beta-galactosidase [Tepidisphaeraceae bacterium]
MNYRIALLSAFLAVAPALADAPRPFSHPNIIRYDGHCLTIDGKDTFIFSGCFHYFRCPKELWQARMTTLKAMGLNCIETYVPWNISEAEKPAGLNDFSKVNLTDLDDFLTLAEKNGLYVIIRPGPYICAEWDGGGLPRWLLPMRPASAEPGHWFRSDDPTFVAWSRHWYKAVCPVIDKHLITRRAPGTYGVILFQLENEYDYSGMPEDVKMRYVKDLAEEAKADGIDVPFFTCWTAGVRGSDDSVLRGVFDSCNFYPRWNVDGILSKMDDLRQEQPDAPMMTTELQGGWFMRVGGHVEFNPDKPIYEEGCTPAQIQNLTLYVIQNGDTITNYYMAFGGTNFGDHAARDITTSYDYSCPVRECGGIDEKYLRVQAIGDMLKKYGTSLARSTEIPLKVSGEPMETTVAERQGDDGASFFFVRTSQHDEDRQGKATVTELAGQKRTFTIPVDLEPMGSKVLYLAPGVNYVSKGIWLPHPIGTIARPKDIPAAVPITTDLVKADNGPDAAQYDTGSSAIPDPQVYDSRNLFYRLSIDPDKTTNLDNLNLNFTVKHPDALVLETSDGKIHQPDLVSTDSITFFGRDVLQTGHNDLTLLYECAGHANGGAAMEDPAQITGVFIGRGSQPKPIGGWKMMAVKFKGKANRLKEVAADYDFSDWADAKVSSATQIPAEHSAIFRTELDVTHMSPPPVALQFGQIKGAAAIFVDGRQMVTQDDPALEAHVALSKKVASKPIEIAVVVTAHEDDGGIADPAVIPAMGVRAQSLPFKLAVATDSPGTTGQWYASKVDDSQWQSQPIGQTAPAAAAVADPPSLLTWHRLKFSLPAQDPHVWVPWCATLNMSGNAFLYLNGHPLGRYWNVGPQHDFYLPECWLNFGANSQNVLTVCLRPVSGPTAAIESAEVRPYSAYAEVR